MQKTLIDEQKLVRKAKKNPEDFSRLYDIYFPKIFRYVSWRIGNQLDAEDIVSEVFVKVIDKINTFKLQKGATFSSWIFRIAHNAVVDYYRKQDKMKSVNLDDLPEIESDELLPSEELDKKELFKKLFLLVQKLPPRQAEIISMRFFTGMKNKEIAVALGVEEKSVSSALCRGLKTLHNNYSKQ